MAGADTTRTRVLVLGATGMLGSMIADVLSRDPGLAVTATARDAGAVLDWSNGDVRWEGFDGHELGLVSDHDWIVNAIGVIKPLIREDDAGSVEDTVFVNSLLPHRLAAVAAESGARVLQIATDCVYSGTKGDYAEDDPHDPLDVYGKTKSLGEVAAENVHHVRASIIGPEAGRSRSLLEWFRGQEERGALSGYVNHRWNGVTTLAFANVCRGVVTGAALPPLRHHLVPADQVTKLELLELFASSFDRGDLTIAPVDAPTVVDRTLVTTQAGANDELWRAAGYDAPPTIAQMVEELARFDYRPAHATATLTS